MKKILFLIIVLTLLIISCSSDFNDNDGYADYGENNGPPSGLKRNFWAQDLTNNSFYKVEAQWLAYNNRCEVWVETNNNKSVITEEQAKKIADEYKDKIYPRLINAFGSTYNISGVGYVNTMQFADWISDGNKRLTILLLDIKDNYENGVNNSYVAGYFWGGDLYKKNTVYDGVYIYEKSNECDMIFIDIDPGMKSDDAIQEAFSTLAHETQHLMNFATSYLYASSSLSWRSDVMDLWINEGLSSAAEYVYSGKVDTKRVKWYNDDSTGYIAKGDNFFIWENHYNKEDPNTHNTVLNDYATVSLFFQWLRLQHGEGIYKKIFSAHYSDYHAVSSSVGTAWEELFRNWHAANYIQNSSGTYGYKNDSVLKTVAAKYFNAKNLDQKSTTSLYPGEAVYSYSAGGLQQMPTASEKVKYYGLKKSGTVDTNKVLAEGALLSFNSDTNINGSAATSTVTGETPPASKAAFSAALISTNDTLPYRIDAGDMIGREKFENDFSGVRLPGRIEILND